MYVVFKEFNFLSSITTKYTYVPTDLKILTYDYFIDIKSWMWFVKYVYSLFSLS